eukprot:TRINITY_DN508_c0_g1_i1.p1 TRINITY_DN508_c0_g1~~TRINITY_DN508_c0_g1_i1.p1  ORF type:complete len:356 (+),score=104.34 TRINITY_DN508_c0_g1_i1:137-1204(+)
MSMGGDIRAVSQIAAADSIHRDGLGVKKTIDEYYKLFDESDTGKGSVDARNANYQNMVNDFYNMVTDIYELGWGESFHFAPRHKWETFAASIARHEMYLAHKIKLDKGMVALDLGCGVGGPGRTMARFSEAKIIGLNNNDHQIDRCRKLTAQQGLTHLLSYMKADWMNIPIQDNSFDAVFHLEALEHSPDRVASFKEIYRILKPGCYFGGYDWVVTDKYNPNNPAHVRCKKAIEVGNGVADLLKPSVVLSAIKEAGFEIVEHKDFGVLEDPKTMLGWWDSLVGGYTSIEAIKHSRAFFLLTNKLLWVLETARIAPKGTLDVHNLLVKVAADLVEGGETGIFSPSYFYLCRKPLDK